MGADSGYLNDIKMKKIPVKIFLDSGTMLQGVVNDFDDKCIVLDKCLINFSKVISIAHLER